MVKKNLTSMIAMCLFGTIAGCSPPAANTPPVAVPSRPAPPPAGKEHVDVKAPGVNIKIDTDKKVRDGKSDVKVDAPGTRVDVDK